MTLQLPATDETLLKRFKTRLQSRLQGQAMLVTGSFHTVLSNVPRLWSAQQVVFIERFGDFQKTSADFSALQSTKLH